ncbi:pyrimidine 5'-nucleotidase [Azospira restricta]|uniref:Pyrimidine 5'-nucleotidase n=1 Tax=Azospira restricta TaxID=404405 RepID=A0A974SRD8_9RHOO|nr:pyrimidine 5'-nucleotidase [Azospira restricta]QRJ65116.1 pyrimidine 5'-nucleotidase [Azospira restricta]
MTSQRTWLFDLDNTLHDASPHIFPHINRSMREYIERHLGVDEREATRIRQTYWDRYGATLTGLMRHHGTDPRHFLRETHRFDDLQRMLVCERGLRATLQRLPGRKIIFSNAPRHYTEAVLRLTGIRREFAAVYSIEQLRFRPKPAVAGFLRILRRERLAAKQCVMVEDSLANLVTARKLGMKTVWVSAGLRRSTHADVRLARITRLPAFLGRL